MTVEIAPLGGWGGAAPLAEYDAEADTVRIDARALQRIRDRLGERGAHAFVTYAVAHETFHRLRPNAGEADAHRYARAVSKASREAFEMALRAHRPR